MKTPRYICSKCRQPFTRRWNAYRHSNNKHFGSIEDIISFTEYTSNQTDSFIPLNGFYEDNNNSHHPINVKNQLFFDKPISFKNDLLDTLLEPLDDALERESSSYEYWINWLQSMKKCNVLLIVYPNLFDRSYLAMLYLQQSILIIL